MQIEDITKDTISKTSDQELYALKSRAGQLYVKHFVKGSHFDMTVDELLGKYKLVFHELKKRGRSFPTSQIDKALFRKVVEEREAIAKPYPNEHACRLKPPGAFRDDGWARVSREHSGKKYDAILGKLKGEQTLTEQAYRYDKNTWSADEARSHCADHDGRFEAAVNSQKSEDTSKAADGANDLPSDDKPDQEFQKFVPVFDISKAEDEHICAGIVYEPDTVDAQGDSATEEEIRKACYCFMEDAQRFKIDHDGKPAKVRVLENYIAPQKFSLGGNEIKKGSWVLITRVLDTDLWNAIKKGEKTGYSMAGTAVRS